MEQTGRLDFYTQLSKVFDFSLIRAQKLVETVQFAAIYIIFGMAVGITLEKIFPKENQNTLDSMPSWKLYSLFFLRMSLIVIFSFYIRKIATLIPFVLHVTDDYISGYKLGGSLMLTFSLYKTQPSFVGMIDQIAKRWS
jgi:hypothetical protein